MVVLQYILGSLVLIVSAAIIFAILMQEGGRAGINGAISGGADTFLSKNKARSAEAFLSRWTKYITVALFVLVLVINVISIVAANTAK